MREKISVCITAGNEEKNIRRCLESVRWADEIIVVDSFSTDRTVAICREYTQLVYQHRWMGYIGQKNLIKNMARYPWVLFLDADEEVSPELRDEILRELESPDAAGNAGYEFPRMVYYLGRWIRHCGWYPDYRVRLFDRDRAEKVAGVSMPDALDRKYPGASTEWQWFWVFPSGVLSVDPRERIVRRHHIHETGLQKAVKDAAAKADKPGNRFRASEK
jgi:glycosyltransferase involved in cell wall biosynthesis